MKMVKLGDECGNGKEAGVTGTRKRVDKATRLLKDSTGIMERLLDDELIPDMAMSEVATQIVYNNEALLAKTTPPETLETAEEPLASGALAVIRDLLDDGGVPRGTFADDQVRNLVALYNQSKARADEAERLLSDVWAQIEAAEFEDIESDDDLVVITVLSKQASAIRAFLNGAKPQPDPLLVEARADEAERLLRQLLPSDFDEHPEDFAPEWHDARALLDGAESQAPPARLDLCGLCGGRGYIPGVRCKTMCYLCDGSGKDAKDD